MQTIKKEEIAKMQKDLQEKCPNSFVGILPLKNQDSFRFEVRVESEDEMTKIPKEFEGYDVNTIAVGEEQFKKISQRFEKVKQPQ